MKLVPFSTIFVTGLMVFGCSPADPAVGDGTGGKPAGSGGSSVATGGTNASGGTTGSGGATSSGGATNTGGATGTGGAIAGTGGDSASGGAPGSGGAATGTGGRMGMGTGGSMGMGTGGSGSGPSFAAVATIMGSSCGTGMCHQPAGPHVDLTNNAGLRGRLVGGMPNGSKTMAMCKTKTLVVAGNPAASVISQVIKGPMAGCTNARMPDECSTTSTKPRACLTMAQIATIDDWIMGGANP
ncbi:MAG: hypothetical protein ABIS92_08845 [Polyangia bacterium]